MRAFDIHNHLTFSLNMYDDESYEYPGPSSRRSYPVADGDLKRMGVAWMEARTGSAYDERLSSIGILHG